MMDFVAAEDVTLWVRSVAEFLKETKTNILDLKTAPISLSNLKTKELQVIFDALEDSEVTEVNLILDRDTEREHDSSKRKVNILIHDFLELASGNFSKLKTSYRPQNTIRSLSKILPKTNVRKLNLGSCRLTGDDLLTLMAVLKNTQITEVDISKNQIRTEHHLSYLFSYISSTCVTSLNLANNHIKCGKKSATIIAQMLPETQLTYLNLGNINFCRPEDLCNLINSLQFTKITDLNLRGTRLNHRDKISCPLKLLGEILGMTKLEKLDLSENFIRDCDVDILTPGLLRSKITHLNLNCNSIYGLNILLPCLRHTRITNLDLSENPIDIGKNFLNPDFLAYTTLDTLLIRSCETTVVQPAEFNSRKFDALVSAIRRSKLTYISLSDNELTADDFFVLAKSLRGSTIKHIRLNTTRRMKDIKNITLLLVKTEGSAVISVDMRCNHLEPEDAAPLASSLACTSLLAVDFRNNYIEKGISRLTEQLKFTAIVYLNLNGNYIGNEGVIALASCLEETQITILALNDNSITSQGAISLSLALKKSKLRHLSLQDNFIDDIGMEALAENAENTCITYINVSANPGKRILLVDSVMWKNREKIQQFADLMKRTALFTGKSDVLEFSDSFNSVNISEFIDDCLLLCKFVVDEPFVVKAIEQDRLILNLEIDKCFELEGECCVYDGKINVFFEDCSLIYKKVMKQQNPVSNSLKHRTQCPFLSFLSEKFPIEFVLFIVRAFDADMTKLIFILKRVEALGLHSIMEQLLLHRPLYVIDKSQNILHPFVYKLLHKCKQPICNLHIEPNGIRKIVEYFTQHSYMEGASEVVSLLSDNRTSCNHCV